jgi:hypothetical protein
MTPTLFLVLCGYATVNSASTEPCTGNSTTLKPADCAAYQKFFDATNGRGWKHCSQTRHDPCACSGNGFLVYCAVTTMPGVLPHVTTITNIVFVSNNLTGTLPSALAELAHLKQLWLPHNKLTGTVPSLPFAQYTSDCHLNDLGGSNKFRCPLPAGSDQCKYSNIPISDQVAARIVGVHCTGSSPTRPSPPPYQDWW